MSGAPRPWVMVAGIGNPDRGDDGFAAAVIARLRDRVPRGVRCHARSGDILALLDAWDGSDAVILVDAAAPIVRPGRVHRVDLADGPLPVVWQLPSTHAFGLGETVELARSLGRLPRRLVLYLAEGENFDAGAPLSAAVAAAVDVTVQQILAELSTILPADQPLGAVADA
jgi:hydrogenase maturation protease